MDLDARREYNRAYYLKNREKIRAAQSLRRSENPEKTRDAGRAAHARWRKRHPETVRANRTLYYEQNSEKINAAHARRRRENPDMDHDSYVRRRLANPEKVRAGGRAALRRRWVKDPERMRMASRKKESKRRACKKGATVENVDPAVVLKRDEGTCGICREPITGDWHIDHIVPLARGGEHSYKNTQAAHPLCNMSKGARLPEGVSL